MHTETRTRLPRVLVLHDNEGPEGVDSAGGLARYLLRNGSDGGGYQATFDDRNIVTVVGDDVVCWANGAINHDSLDGCIVGYASQTSGQWADLFDKGYGNVPGAIENAAQWFAGKCKQYSIPPTLLTGRELFSPVSRGITTHGLLTAAGYPGTEGHTDPGGSFPLAPFVQRVGNIIVPPIDWVVVEKLADWEKHLAVRYLRPGDRGPLVVVLNHLLVMHRVLSPKAPMGVYSHETIVALAHYKRLCGKHVFKDTDGRRCGSWAARQLLAR